jgi:hypothetical protein
MLQQVPQTPSRTGASAVRAVSTRKSIQASIVKSHMVKMVEFEEF